MKTQVTYDDTTFTYEERDGKIVLCQRHSPEVCTAFDDPEVQEGLKLYLTDLCDKGATFNNIADR